MSDSNLYALNATYLDILNRVAEQQGEISDDDDKVMNELATKVDACHFVIQKLSAEAGFYSQEIARLQNILSNLQNAQDRLSGYMHSVAELSPGKRLDGNTVAYKITNNPPSVEINARDLIPPEYIRETVQVTHSVDKKKIAEDLKKQVPVPGAALVTRTKLTLTKPVK